MSSGVSLLQRYFPELPLEKQEKFILFAELFKAWNEKINLVSRKDIDQFYLHHLLHSLVIAKFIDFGSGTKVMDIGTGGGLPGLPLAIYFHETQFYLVDSIRKKTEAVKAMADQLELSNVTVINQRAEEVAEKVDFVVSRATAPLSDLVNWSRGKINAKSKASIPNGLICLKGGDLTEELKPFENKLFTENVTAFIQEEFYKEKKIIYLPLV
ncbi:MAG: 16S rRNA (guanine(527)-N(7))-methyltransferase RsmG [Bacteroidetes bacterium]|nr:16S rRNA (guanine(527)-N(7))-methyltransferase RsmG [Bacteroidota bacterium]MBX7240026.1 16S rRNA (guanine(527)-N(7))-methyltransferase RsmG [Bacteroidia bacterium]HMU77883.1 16S rRNA (guanine(527)-N(7))-methyltransferase RsmG [Bacteroidia bacterium]HMX97648.1 16S rRNA (guanine(527)-N(7))-methyltransferase RsmG [Bacteroidia bacterium]HMY14289.1 16S rRNA (guanine(527)-N(7))-methyltransferase RsmG [Bacteroidia bacterium]